MMKLVLKPEGFGIFFFFFSCGGIFLAFKYKSFSFPFAAFGTFGYSQLRSFQSTS